MALEISTEMSTEMLIEMFFKMTSENVNILCCKKEQADMGWLQLLCCAALHIGPLFAEVSLRDAESIWGTM
jgi:hypothetical protein